MGDHSGAACAGLCRKAYLAYNLKKWAAKNPDGVIAKSVPETFLLSVDDVEYIDEALSDLPEVRSLPFVLYSIAS